MRFTYLSIQSTDPDRMGEACRRAGEEIGIDVAFSGFLKEDCEDDVLRYDELCRSTNASDAVFIRSMGDPWKFKRFDRYAKVLKASGAYVVPVSGNIDVDLMTRDLFPGSDGDLKELMSYAVFKCPENDSRFIRCIARKLGFTDVDPPPAIPQPRHGLYRPVSDDGTDAITVGIVCAHAQVAYGDSEAIDALISGLEAEGMRVIPVACSFDCMREPGGMEEVIGTYFVRDGRPAVDVLISLTGYANLNRADGNIPDIDEESCLRRLIDVPVIYGISIRGRFCDYEDEKIGMKKGDFQSNVIYPELDGNIISVPISYSSPDPPTRSFPIPDRIEHLCRLAKAWGTLRRTPVEERRVAIMMWQARPNSGMIGAASGLDTVESVADLLKHLASLGYRVDGVPADGRGLIEEILAHVTNDMDGLPMSAIRDRAADLVSKGGYLGRYGRVHGWDRRMTEESWDAPVGRIMVDGGDLVIPGLVKGNVFVCYQPMRGWADLMERNIHDPLLFTQHQYNAYYWWIKDVFRADMVFHMGTHGTLEWLPGLNVGLSGKCNPDYVLDALPNVYPYIINDPGEGVQAKRRSESVLVSHMPPTMARADSYTELDEVNQLLQDYLKYASGATEATRRSLVERLYGAAKRNNLLNDLGVPEGDDPGPEGFEALIIPLHCYLEQVRDTLVRSDLHILGRVPSGDRFHDMVYSLTRSDNGDVPSLRDAFAAERGVDLRAALDDPSWIGPDGELNSSTVERIDSEVRGFIRMLGEEFGYDADEAIKYLESTNGHVGEELASAVRFACGSVVPNIRRMGYEIDHMMDALDGRFVIPGPSGAPTRGDADILPTGRNFYGLDPDTVPTKASWEVGRRMADQMIERHVADRGEYPREVGIVVWATDMMKTGGDDAAYILWLLGLKPVWSSAGGQVVDVEVVPVSELGRPRVDVTLNITGLFRDTFPATIDFLDDAMRLVADLDESDEENAVAANLRRDMVEDIAAGLSVDEARARNSVRIFGEALGTYGNGVGNLIETSLWDETRDLADIYAEQSSYGYSKGDYGKQMKGSFMRRFGRVSATVKNVPTREIDILDIDDVYQYLGGMNAFVRTYGRADAGTYIGDSSDPKRTGIRDTREELRFLFRAKVVNPKFINGLMEHGYRGAAEMAKIVEYTFAWDATSDIAEGWMYDTLADRYLLDEKVREWVLDVNPHAMMNMINTLHEAVDRGMWEASDERLERMKQLFMETEAVIEGRMDVS